jgi:sugar phosphate isomerase/epimerase
MKLSLLNYILVPTWPLDRILGVAQAMGCAGIELRIERGFAAGPEVESSPEERLRIREQVTAAGLEIACLGTNSSFDTPDPTQRQAVVDHTKRLIELAADVDCRRIRVFGDRLPPGVPPLDCARYVGESLRPLGECGASYGVDVLLEMHNDFNDPDLALTAVQTADHPSVALVYNCDERDVSDGSIQATYDRVRPWIRHVHMHELGNGFPYQELFARLQADDYAGFLSTELEAQDTLATYLLTYAALFKTWANESAAGAGGQTHAARAR